MATPAKDSAICLCVSHGCKLKTHTSTHGQQLPGNRIARRAKAKHAADDSAAQLGVQSVAEAPPIVARPRHSVGPEWVSIVQDESMILQERGTLAHVSLRF
jgi:hypothetical protein